MQIQGIPKKALVERIRHEFPNLHIRSARRILSGWDNVVLDVNNRFIFRFPRFKRAEKTLQFETKLLPLLRDHLRVEIPNYTYIAQARRDQYAFAGYKKIAGTPVTVTGYRASWTPKLSKSFANFLRQLHSIKTTGEISSIVSHDWTTKRMQKYHDQLRKIGYRYLDRNTRQTVEFSFKESIQLLGDSRYKPALIHSDLTDRNILVNPHTGLLSGILDWGDARISDPALDFCGLFEVNRDLGYATVSFYGGSRDFLDRVDVYWRMLPYFEILYGIYSGHDTVRNRGLTRIRTRLKAPRLSERFDEPRSRSWHSTQHSCSGPA
jgi:aminoglycoside 2''-phosphotransferase